MRQFRFIDEHNIGKRCGKEGGKSKGESKQKNRICLSVNAREVMQSKSTEFAFSILQSLLLHANTSYLPIRQFIVYYFNFS
jgi:hypothetical protein